MVERIRTVLLFLLAFAMIGAGVMHFVEPAPFERIMPAWLPAHTALVYISGAFEILGGVGLLVPATRRFASLGLVALFIAVFPANINMAIHEIQLDPANPMPVWAMWARLPVQGVLIAWAWWVGRPPPEA